MGAIVGAAVGGAIVRGAWTKLVMVKRGNDESDNESEVMGARSNGESDDESEVTRTVTTRAK